jgi:hypothetical protein
MGLNTACMSKGPYGKRQLALSCSLTAALDMIRMCITYLDDPSGQRSVAQVPDDEGYHTTGRDHDKDLVES